MPEFEKPARNILIEIVSIGIHAKVSAIDPATGVEVSITGPASMPRASLEAAAIKKLEFMFKKKGGG